MRLLANRELALSVYTDVVKEWLRTEPFVPVRTKIGPKLCKDFRQVTPGAVCSLDSLLTNLIKRGLTTGVVQSTKLQQSLLAALQSDKITLGTWDLMEAAGSLSTHIMRVLELVREYGKEEMDFKGVGRRYPRSGGFRKSMSGQDTEFTTGLTSMMQLKEHDSSSSTSMMEPIKVVPSTINDEDDDDYMAVFGFNSSSSTSWNQGPSEHTAPSSSLLLDDTQPQDTDFDCKEVFGFKDAEEDNLNAEIEALIPDPRKRKVHTIAIRKETKKQATTTPKKQAKPETTTTPQKQATPTRAEQIKDELYKAPIEKVHIASTKTAPARCELTGYAVGHKGVRLHILTLHEKAWGSSYKRDAQFIAGEILAHRHSKFEAEHLRDCL